MQYHAAVQRELTLLAEIGGKSWTREGCEVIKKLLISQKLCPDQDRSPMPAVQYPFIDIAVHARVRDRFARGEAIVLFSADLQRVLWANGAGAALFGNSAIYDFLEEGPSRNDITFRQMDMTARQLGSVGDSRSFLVRIPAGFQRIAVQASVERIRTQAGEIAVLFASPVGKTPVTKVPASSKTPVVREKRGGTPSKQKR